MTRTYRESDPQLTGWPRHHVRWHRGLIWTLILLMMAGLAFWPANVGATPRLALTITGTDASRFPWVTSYLAAVNENSYPVLGLDASRFEVKEDGVPATTVELSTVVDSEEPLAVVVVVDASGSMGDQAMADAKNAAATFIRELGERDQGSLFVFSTEVRELHGFTRDKDALLQAVGTLKPGGNTALYDALFTAVDATSRSDITRKIVVLETDGFDTSSKAAVQDGINLARQTGVPVYTIGLGKDIDQRMLREIASSTGGSALVAPTSADLGQAFRTVTDQLRNQYFLRYLSPAPMGAKSYRLAVTVSRFPDKATAETTFTARPVPPTITGFSLTEGAVLAGTTTVAVDVESAQPVLEVWLEVDGRWQAQATTPPYHFTLEPARLAGGRHTVKVHVTDSAGSTRTAQAAVTVPAVEKAAPAPPVREPAWAFPGLPVFDLRVSLPALDLRLVFGLVGLLMIVAVAGYEVWKLVKAARSRLKEVTCPACHSKYPAYEEACPECWLAQQLAQDADRTLGDLLVENKLLSRADLEAAVAQSAELRKPLDVVLLEAGKVSVEQLQQAQFYLGRSVAMSTRRRDLMLSRRQNGPWNAAVFVPRLVVLVVAAVVLVLAAATMGTRLAQLWA